LLDESTLLRVDDFLTGDNIDEKIEGLTNIFAYYEDKDYEVFTSTAKPKIVNYINNFNCMRDALAAEWYSPAGLNRSIINQTLPTLTQDRLLDLSIDNNLLDAIKVLINHIENDIRQAADSYLDFSSNYSFIIIPHVPIEVITINFMLTDSTKKNEAIKVETNEALKPNIVNSFGIANYMGIPHD
jgi:hypothetical protein